MSRLLNPIQPHGWWHLTQEEEQYCYHLTLYALQNDAYQLGLLQHATFGAAIDVNVDEDAVVVVGEACEHVDEELHEDGEGDEMGEGVEKDARLLTCFCHTLILMNMILYGTLDDIKCCWCFIYFLHDKKVL